jgi:preprotein translocase subunit SecD
MKLNVSTYLVLIVLLLSVVSLVLFPLYRGVVVLAAFIAFGVLSSVGKEEYVKVLALLSLLVLSVINVLLYGLNFGIEFSGGMRIPVLLSQPVDSNTLDEIVSVLKKRTSFLGMTQVRVFAVGNQEIDVELPKVSDEQLVSRIKDVILKQGKFLAVIDGKVALSGEHVLPGTVYKEVGNPAIKADWAVSFSVDRQGGEQFAQAAKGKAYYPVYMFLDRPHNADVFIDEKLLTHDVYSQDEVLKALKDACRLENDTIRVFVVGKDALPENGSGRLAIVYNNKSLINTLQRRGYEVVVKNLTFSLTKGVSGLVVERWDAIGLLSAPALNPGIASGMPSFSYMVTGSASGSGEEKWHNAMEEAKRIETLLKSGALPVSVSVGSSVSIPSPLGKQFLTLSFIALGVALLAIAIFIAIRYKHPTFVFPILGISLAELIVLMSVIGSFTIDVAAMAGIIAAIGVGVDAQIVITDELLKSRNKESLKRAFGIIGANVLVAITVMLPLLFSNLVEVINFALSSIFGALLGYLISRPAYAFLLESLFLKNEH